MRILFFFCSVLLLSNAALAKLSPADFAKNKDYYAVKISPDGKYLALGVEGDQRRHIAILSTTTFQTIGGINFGGRQMTGDFFWANDERLIIEVWEKRLRFAQPRFYGELFAVNYDGSDSELVYGSRAGEMQTGSRIKKRQGTDGHAEILHPLPGEPKFVLISSTPYSEEKNITTTIHKLNIYTGVLSRIMTRSPVYNPHIIADSEGNVRFASGLDSRGDWHLYQYIVAEDRWQVLDNINAGFNFQLMAMDGKGENLFYINNLKGKLPGLFKYSLSTSKSKHLYSHESVEISQLAFSPNRDSVYALKVDAGYPEYIIFNKSSNIAKRFRSFLASFKGANVAITSFSEDQKYWVVFTHSDTNPGTYYLYDQEANQLMFLMGVLESIDTKALHPMEAVQFTASDGVKINGFLTTPKGQKKAPLVTLVHGGPHNIRDFWGYNEEVQMLSNEGYAVLQVNFRGSSGYGREFEQSGYKRWGDRIQQDIIDGTLWAMKLPEVSDEKACIMGASFGGYSAVQSPILAPDLYRCSVATVGVYDLEMMYEKGDIPGLYYGESMLKRYIGEDKASLRKHSPVHQIGKLNTPVLIAHGSKDERVPIEQAEALRDALEKANKPFEWYIKKDEAHGFFDPQNRGEYYQTVAKFLAKHLK